MDAGAIGGDNFVTSFSCYCQTLPLQVLCPRIRDGGLTKPLMRCRT